MKTPEATITDPVILIRIPRAFRTGMSDLELYEATRGVWKIGPRRELARYALAIYQDVVQEVYEILRWDRAWTTPYQTRTFKDTSVPGRWEFVGRVAVDEVRERYRGKSVREHFSRGSQTRFHTWVFQRARPKRDWFEGNESRSSICIDFESLKADPPEPSLLGVLTAQTAST